MKTIILLLSLLFCFSCNVQDIEPQEMKLNKLGSAKISDGLDYKTKSTGNYSDTSIWMKKDINGNWVDAHNFPDESNNIFIEAGTTLLFDSIYSCKDLNLNNTADTIRINTNNSGIIINGKLRVYSGTAPGTSDGINAGVVDWIQGTLVFKGSVDRTIIHSPDYSAHANNKGFDMIFDFDNGVTGVIDQSSRWGNVIVKNGILKILPLHSLRPSGNGGLINGDLTVKSGATLIGGHFFKSQKSPFKNFYLESGASLFIENTIDPIFAAENLYINGYVDTIGTTNSWPSTGGRVGATQL